jgi:hypothetical protein
VLIKRHCAICTNRVNIIRVEYSKTIGLHFSRKVSSIIDEKARIYWVVFHCMLI